MSTASAAGASLDVEAYRRLYPEEFYSRFFAEGVRPDGRPIGRARPTSIGLGAVATADGSALVKIGNTTMLAGVKLEVMTPGQDAPNKGRITVEFEMPALCAPRIRPGRPAEEAYSVGEQVQNALTSSGLVNEEELCIEAGRAAWAAHLDILCLDADGALLDAALLASAAALADLQLPAVAVTSQGRVVPPSARKRGRASAAPTDPSEQSPEQPGDALTSSKTTGRPARRLTMGPVPVALTCGLYGEHLLVDPSADEEALAGCSVSVVLDRSSRLVGLYKPGGTRNASTATLQDCIAAAKLRAEEVLELFEATLEEAGVDKTADRGDEQG